MRATFQKVVQPILRKAWLLVALLIAVTIVTTSPAVAHENHKKKVAAEQSMQRAGQPGVPSETTAAPDAMHSQMGDMMDDMDMDRSKMTWVERLRGWIGRMHPMVVHFPIAFFPAALFTAIVGRKRPAFSAPVQFLVVAGGIFAPVAAVAGWLAGMDADPEAVLTYHRWLGVVVGVAGAGLGIWAWKRPWEDRGTGMITALTLMTIAIAAQGFMGASITHGMDHMMF